MFGLSNGEGNHGEDVKEYWFYLDSTPTHSYLKCQYKYPQRAFPYEDLVATNARRTKQDMEYELLDTGVFDDDRYFDVVVEYAKAVPGRHRDARHRLQPRAPTRRRCTSSPRCGSATPGRGATLSPSRRSRRSTAPPGLAAARATHHELGEWLFRADASATLLFCENETNSQRLFGTPNASPYVKDGINDFVVDGVAGAVNPERTGTKVAAHHVLEIGPRARAPRCASALTAGATARRRTARSARGFDRAPERPQGRGRHVLRDGDPAGADADQALVMRQALGGLLWGKQYYEYDVHRWLREHGVDPWGPNAPASGVRNVQWFHMIAGDIISMPDKWEYPWFAAWDLAFHCAPLSLVDVDFAKEQMELLLKTRYQHPNGQIPAYEWNFSDVNPPVTPWAALYVYEREAEIRGEGDHEFLARVFDRLMTNFTWWVNRKDPDDRNLFQGGFLGLDNIGMFDRSAPLPGGGTARAGRRDRVDGPLLPVDAPDRARAVPREPAYIDMALKFIAHFMCIAVAMNPPGGRLDAVGRPRRLLLRRDADAGRDADRAEGALARRAAADVRRDRVRARRRSTATR